MAIMLDSCIYLDVFTQDPRWFPWSSQVVADAADSGTIVLNSVIYSEISVRFKRIEEVEDLLPPVVFEYRTIPKEAAFLAGKCFAQYRRSGGPRLQPLPDFFIGAHAAVENLALVTRDPARFRKHFPSVMLITPERSQGTG